MNTRCNIPFGKMTRNNFIRNCTKLIGLGVVTRFSIIGVFASNTIKSSVSMSNKTNALIPDVCPGGGDDDDVCDDNDPDNCPGESSNVDNCLGTTVNPDRCNTGVESNDICSATERDQCESGIDEDDVCDSRSSDYCPNDQPPLDNCPPTGGFADGDNCAGGGIQSDTCENGQGDECGFGDFEWGPDSCSTEGGYDECPFSDDTCNEGTTGLSGQDVCTEMINSDSCADGTPENDICNIAEPDVCPRGEATVDDCSLYSDDYCNDGSSSSDLCSAIDPDDCPGGGNEKDTCLIGSDDECTSEGGCAGGDQSNENADTCAGGLTDTCKSGTPDAPTPPVE